MAFLCLTHSPFAGLSLPDSVAPVKYLDLFSTNQERRKSSTTSARWTGDRFALLQHSGMARTATQSPKVDIKHIARIGTDDTLEHTVVLQRFFLLNRLLPNALAIELQQMETHLGISDIGHDGKEPFGQTVYIELIQILVCISEMLAKRNLKVEIIVHIRTFLILLELLLDKVTICIKRTIP